MTSQRRGRACPPRSAISATRSTSSSVRPATTTRTFGREPLALSATDAWPCTVTIAASPSSCAWRQACAPKQALSSSPWVTLLPDGESSWNVTNSLSVHLNNDNS